MKKYTHSVIARKTLIPVMIVMLVLICLFSTLSYKYVNNMVKNEQKKTLREIADSMILMIDDIKENSNDATYVSEFEKIAQLLCTTHDIDYICLFVPDLDNDTVLYKSIVYNPDYPNIPEDSLSYYQIPVSYKLLDEEKEVLTGKQKYTYINYQNMLDVSLSSIIRVQLPSGSNALASIEKEYTPINKRISKILVFQLCFIVFVNLLCCAVFYIVIRKYVSKPAGIISEAMNKFITDEQHSLIKMPESGKDEFSSINRAFNKMADDIDYYIKNISNQKAEIDIAAKIQQGLLPKSKSFFNGCQIRTMMKPAKEIGGDLYDYLELDDDNCLVMIADVSGKGVSAAVFMTATLVMLRQFARLKMQPSEILKNTNRELSANNPFMLFVTAFVGIYNNKTMKFTYSNAGHNYPYLIDNHNVTLLNGSTGTVLGLFEDEQYEQTTVQLNTGDSLFLYTDGVNEAVNDKHEFFGIDRLEKCLADYKPNHQESLIDYINGKVHGFTVNAAQNDDITMLSLTSELQNIITLSPDKQEFEKIKAVIMNSNIPQNLKLPLCLTSEEIFVNICSYAFENTDGERIIKFSLYQSDHIEVSFEDNGIKYNPLENDLTNPDEYDVDNQIGGLGKVIIFGIADDINYEYKNNRNILTIKKYKEEKEDDIE